MGSCYQEDHDEAYVKEWYQGEERCLREPSPPVDYGEEGRGCLREADPYCPPAYVQKTSPR